MSAETGIGAGDRIGEGANRVRERRLRTGDGKCRRDSGDERSGTTGEGNTIDEGQHGVRNDRAGVGLSGDEERRAMSSSGGGGSSDDDGRGAFGGLGWER